MQYINQIKIIVKSNFKNKAVFFDRDGVVNQLIERDGGFYSPRNFDEFKFHSDLEQCIDICLENNFLIIIISNQPDISRKKMNISELKKMDELMKSKIHIDAIYYSFDDVYYKEGLKKPSPKMIFNAQKELEINLKKSLFIGDSKVDIECAANAGVNFILIKREHNQDLFSENFIMDLTQIRDFIND